MSAIDPAMIAKLLAGERKRTPRTKTLERNYDTWFDPKRVDHIIDSECAVPDHEDRVHLFDFHTNEDYQKAISRRHVVAEIKGIRMCRYCFISGAREDESN
jgi:hypothetical protein